METIRRGNAAEAAVLNAFVKADLDVYLPFGDGMPCDLVVGTELVLIKVQVKSGRIRNECIEFNSASTDHGRGRQDYRGRADVFGVHFPPTDGVYLVPVDAVGRNEGRLRLDQDPDSTASVGLPDHVRGYEGGVDGRARQR